MTMTTPCILCKSTEETGSDDCWDGLCPSCASRVLAYMDHAGCSRSGAIRDLENDPTLLWE